MKKIIYSIMTIALLGFILRPVKMQAGNSKLAQTGFQFLSVVSDARAASLAGAMTSLQTASSALFFNPAGMAEMVNFIDGTASINHWIADIQHNTFSLALNPWNGRFGVIGFSFQNVNYGDLYGTVVNKTLPAGYEDTGIFHIGAEAIGAGYAKKLTNKFSVGGQVRWVHQDLGKSRVPFITTQYDSAGIAYLDTSSKVVDNNLSPLAFDFGTQFKTGFKSLIFGMAVRNFSRELKYEEEGFQIPLVLALGISMDLMDFFENKKLDQSLVLSIDANHYRSHAEQINIGLDYNLMQMLFLRTGYTSNTDENGFSFGLGIARFGLKFDYAYTPYGIFDHVQRMTIRFSL